MDTRSQSRANYEDAQVDVASFLGGDEEAKRGFPSLVNDAKKVACGGGETT